MKILLSLFETPFANIPSYDRVIEVGRDSNTMVLKRRLQNAFQDMLTVSKREDKDTILKILFINPGRRDFDYSISMMNNQEVYYPKSREIMTNVFINQNKKIIPYEHREKVD